MICSTTQNVLISATLSAFLLLSNAFVPIAYGPSLCGDDRVLFRQRCLDDLIQLKPVENWAVCLVIPSYFVDEAQVKGGQVVHHLWVIVAFFDQTRDNLALLRVVAVAAFPPKVLSGRVGWQLAMEY